MDKIKVNDIKVVGICGSLRDKSYTRMALKIALNGARAIGAETYLIDLRHFDLIFVKETDDLPEDVFRLKRLVQDADGIILGTPEYHGSYSGVLKNAIDLMGFDDFQGKMIGMVGVGGGSMGALNSLNHLRTVGRQLHAWVVPKQASIPFSSKQFDKKGNLKDGSLEKRVREVGRQVAKFAFLHRSKEIREFILTWEQAPDNPGGSN